MSWGFKRGQIYNRRRDIHDRFNGSTRDGIVTFPASPLIVAFTGTAGVAHGYHDRLREDGVFEYFGRGSSGDMRFTHGNRAIRDHWVNGKDILLFEKESAGIRFLGQMIYAGHQWRDAPDKQGLMRKAIVFELLPIETVTNADMVADSKGITDLEILRKKAISAAIVDHHPGKRVTVNVYQRSKTVRTYVLARAAGSCEGCGQPAPFLNTNGEPYLEPHHLRRVSDGGPDHPAHVIALCPNCHRRVHLSEDSKTYNAELAERMQMIEPNTV